MTQYSKDGKRMGEKSEVQAATCQPAKVEPRSSSGDTTQGGVKSPWEHVDPHGVTSSSSLPEGGRTTQ